MNKVILKVVEAMSSDVGRGIVRLSEQSMIELGVETGDIVEIKGKASTAAKVWPRHVQDADPTTIRMDGLIRQNSRASLGDKVEVKKADVKDATKVVLAPIQELSFRGEFVDYVKRQLLGSVFVLGNGLVFGILGRPIQFIVVSTQPHGVVRLTEQTDLEVSKTPMEVKVSAPMVRYEDIGGMKEEVEKVREMIELPMKHPVLFEKLGIDPPKGVLLHGAPGTGKTLLAKAVASETQSHFILINGPEIMDKFYGESEKKLRDIFEEAQKNAPSIIFIDEIDSIAPKREETRGEVERRVVAQLLTLMDGMTSRGNVIVIAATNRVDAIDPALRRPGRFDREIEIRVPDKSGRRDILTIHTRGMPLADDVNLDEIVSSTNGFVGADISALAREAAMSALRRILPEIDLDREIPTDIIEKLKVERGDFINALKNVEPSALREVLVYIPTVKWDDIGGLENIKQALKEAVEWPLKFPERYKKMGVRTPKGVLMFGPPGCGKTLLAKAAATESEANFISIKGPEVFSKWVGESEKKIREIFKKARQTSPTIIFFDEMDAIAPVRGTGTGSRVTETVLNQILTEVDGIESLDNVIVIGATNRPDILDPALLRPGRFDSIIFVGPPDRDAVYEILKIHTKNMPLADVDLKTLSEKLEGYTGADIEGVCREAGMVALRAAHKENRDAEHVESRHFEQAIEKIKPSVPKSLINNYKLKREESPSSISYL